MATPLSDFLKPMNFSKEFAIFGKRMRKEVSRNVLRLAEPGPFSQAVTGRSSPGGSLVRQILELKPRVKKRGVSLGPSRAKKFLKLNYFVKGRSSKITTRQQRFLRNLGIEAGVFDEGVLFRPTLSPPFKAGRVMFQKKRDAFHFGRMDLSRPAEILIEKVAETWGFTS